MHKTQNKKCDLFKKYSRAYNSEVQSVRLISVKSVVRIYLGLIFLLIDTRVEVVKLVYTLGLGSNFFEVGVQIPSSTQKFLNV